MSSNIKFVVLVGFLTLGGVYGQSCAALGLTSAGPVIGGCPPGTIQAGTECCNQATATTATTASTVTVVTSVTSGTSTGSCIGPCFSNICPTGYTCNTVTQECCSSTSVTSSTSCVDLVGADGVSDCPALSYLCNNATYYDVMTQQCPRTCGRCSSTSSTVSTTCVDRTNPTTGVSDCPSLSYLCNSTAYTTLMTQQCPLTCGRCSTTG